MQLISEKFWTTTKIKNNQKLNSDSMHYLHP